MICPNCRNELPEDCKFCQNCGAKLDSVPEEAARPAEGNAAPAGGETGFVKLPTLEKLFSDSAPEKTEAAPEASEAAGPEQEEVPAPEAEAEAAPETESGAAAETEAEPAKKRKKVAVHVQVPPELAKLEEDQRFKSLGPSYAQLPEEPLAVLQSKNERLLILLIVCSVLLAVAITLVALFLIPSGADTELTPSDIAVDWSLRLDLKTEESDLALTGVANISYDGGEYVLIHILPVEVLRNGESVSNEELQAVIADCEPVYGLLKDGVLYFNSPLDEISAQIAVPMSRRGGSASFSLDESGGRLDCKISK